MASSIIMLRFTFLIGKGCIVWDSSTGWSSSFGLISAENPKSNQIIQPGGVCCQR